MTESLVLDRIKFNKEGTQRDFILKAKEASKMTFFELSKKLDISQRTLTDWKKEKFNMPHAKAELLAKFTGVSIPKNYSIINWNEHLQKAGKIGGKNKFTKYGNVGGDEKYRKEKWEEWWKTIGKYKKPAKNFNAILKIKIPKKNEKLAEFIGVMLGDGGISKYKITITLSNAETEYISYVSKLIYELFDVMPKVYKLKGHEAVDIVVQRKQLVDFCLELGLVLGNKIKQEIDIPFWIKENKVFSIACLRGLVDTDGCFFIHKYLVNGKKYSYMKISFTSASLPLVSSTAKTLVSLGFNIRISKNHKDIRIEDKKYVDKYIKNIGSHNKKHLDKIKQ